MLGTSIKLLKSHQAWLGTTGIRAFSTKTGGGATEFKSGSGFNFPQHKELFNDEYYEKEEEDGS